MHGWSCSQDWIELPVHKTPSKSIAPCTVHPISMLVVPASSAKASEQLHSAAVLTTPIQYLEHLTGWRLFIEVISSGTLDSESKLDGA